MPEFIQERKSKDGKHVTYRVTIPYYSNNKRVFFTESFSSKKYGSKKIALEMAKECQDKMKRQLVTGIHIDTDITLKDVYQSLDTVYSMSPETKRKYITIYNKYILACIDEFKPFKDITSRDIFSTLEKAKTTSSDNNIARIFSLWKKLYKTAIVNEWVMVDMTIKVIVPKSILPKKKKDLTTSFDELQRVCDELETHMSNKREARLIVLALTIMYYTGIRPAECYALEKTNINLTNRQLTICQSISSDDKRKGFISRTKNETSIRTIPYPKELDSVFEELYTISKGDLLFIKDNGELFTSAFVSVHIRKNTTGNFTAYKLRHQFATDLLLNQTDIRTVQDLMGHTNSSMTIEYARSNDKVMSEAINKRTSVTISVTKNKEKPLK